MSDSIQKAIEEIDRICDELPKADSAGRSHLRRERTAQWVSHQVHPDPEPQPYTDQQAADYMKEQYG